MLSQEAGEQRLAEYRCKDGVQRRLAEVRRLPEPLRRLAAHVVGLDVTGEGFPDYMDGKRQQYAAALEVDRLAEADRLPIFDALFGPLGKTTAAAWVLLRNAPYQIDTTRRPFRAPRFPDVTTPRQAEWTAAMFNVTSEYEQDVTWWAQWVGYFPYYQRGVSDLGWLFAAALEAGDATGRQVFDILSAAVRGDHEIAVISRPVIRGLLSAGDPRGWQLVENLLLAAQRQEGLRQVILETVDEAHPEAFRRMLRLILDEKLARFSAVIRAAGVWFGLPWDVEDVRSVERALHTVCGFLDQVASGAKGLDDGDDPEKTYLALWSIAYFNAPAAEPPAVALLADPAVEKRFIATHFLTQTGFLRRSKLAMLDALRDDDLRVVTLAANDMRGGPWRAYEETDAFERLEAALLRFPRKAQTVDAPVWPWMKVGIDRGIFGMLLQQNLFKRSPERLLPHLALMDPYVRAEAVKLIEKLPQNHPARRPTLRALVGDPSEGVRELAVRALAKTEIHDYEAPEFEALLTRKPGDLRRGVIGLLLKQKDGDALKSGTRLLASKEPLQRQAGLDLLREMAGGNRLAEQARAAGRDYRDRITAGGGEVPDEERELLDQLCGEAPAEQVWIDDAFGLMRPADRTPPPQISLPKRFGLIPVKPQPLITPAALACLRSLDELIQQHRGAEITIYTWDGTPHTELLGDRDFLGWPDPKLSPDEDRQRLALGDVWENWWRTRPAKLRDADGFEIVRMAAVGKAPWRDEESHSEWVRETTQIVFGGTQRGSAEANGLKYTRLAAHIAAWLLRLHPEPGMVDCMLDGLETTLALIAPHAKHVGVWRNTYTNLLGWLELARENRDRWGLPWSPEQHARLWRLLRWIDEPAPGEARHRPQLAEVLDAHAAGAATEADILDQLVAPSNEWYGGYGDLRRESGRKPTELALQHPILAELVEKLRRRIIEVELRRGDLPAATSAAALKLRYSGGLDTLVRLLKGFGKAELVRGASNPWSVNQSRSEVFSHLVRASAPRPEDTPAAFVEAVRAAGIPDKRLLEVALYAPQWSRHVEAALGWPGLAGATRWILAHADAQGADGDIAETWRALIAEDTPLKREELQQGAVDVAWFRSAYAELGTQRWEQVYKAAKLATDNAAYKRSQLFADAMLGRVTEEELVARITEKRHLDSVRALGLLPLQEEREGAALLRRYEILQEFVRTSKQFGAQRQESEKLAATIGMENLARTAGYPDPQRLQWAMEAQSVADLAAGPVRVTEGAVTVELAINPWGAPELTVTKAGKPLKSIPPAVKKDPRVAELQARKTQLERQASRMRQSLEEAMIRGDSFTGAELRGLFRHPILAAMLEDLVLVRVGGPDEGMAGYPDAGGAVLRCHDGKVEPLADEETVRIAHPFDLLQGGEWSEWQHDCFIAERTQPFKQVFRELYLLTETERAEGTFSRRYAGLQVNTKQALALLGGRLWVNHPEEGLRRAFHREGFSAVLEVMGTTWTPADVEGVTLEAVGFVSRGEWKPMLLADVPPRIFSEVMRDLDLVVSVAHAGGVDPEATASTIEMRASLLRETAALLGLSNVRVQKTHALIDGKLANYSLHLGSGVVHRQPGGALCIVPVHGQYRGRIFLPFADNDPRTAEVMSKALLLAKDGEIKDPTILEQILGPRR